MIYRSKAPLRIGLAGGRQDQYAATFGGVNFIEFYADKKVIVNPLRIKQHYLSELENNLVLYYAAANRASARIIAEQRQNVTSKNESSIEAMHQLKAQAQMLKEALLKGKLNDFGSILDFGYRQKRRMAAGISNPLMEAFYETAKGAGGGFMFFYCSGTSKHKVIEALKTFGGQHRNLQFTGHGLTTWTA